MRFDLDPSTKKVCLIASLLFIESFIGSMLLILETDTWPTLIQATKILFVALMVLVTYLLTFLRAENKNASDN